MQQEGKGVPMQDKVAIVTGAGKGIGRVIAARLAREGVAAVVADVDDCGGLETVRQIDAVGGCAAFVRTDVAVEAEVRAMIAFAEECFGGLDILVNNTGIAPEPHFPTADPTHWGRTLDVNLRGTMLGIQFGAQAMSKRGGGVIVNMASMAGIGYRAYDVPEYAASKAGIVRLTAALGSLKEEMGIRVNCICPGWVETPAVKRFLAASTPEEMKTLVFPPPSVLIQPEQIADAVMMFVQDESLAGRVMIWPDGEPWRLVPMEAEY
jgi:NAD(P)-dependent dehydrogenase (short-subunit alcohol dehydrogenase family)